MKIHIISPSEYPKCANSNYKIKLFRLFGFVCSNLLANCNKCLKMTEDINNVH